MKKPCLSYILLIACILNAYTGLAQNNPTASLEKIFHNPPPSAKPWVFWYWMRGAISKEGITADLAAMKEVGIGGAYLMPIQDTLSTIPFQPTARQLTPEWWQLVKFAMEEAKRFGLKLAMHVSDGFALAGGPWITPELSMQKLVWFKTYIRPGSAKNYILPRPLLKTNYYEDIALFAYPVKREKNTNESEFYPKVSTSTGADGFFLMYRDPLSKKSFSSDTACWIQYEYPGPITCRSITIKTGGNNFQAHRLIIQASDDGINFKRVTRLEPPRHGWQDTDEDVTHSIPATTSRYFRFVYDKEGTEPGSEDLDAAKWKPSFKVVGIYVSGEPVINQYESKNGSIWRVSKYTTPEQVPDSMTIPLQSIIRLTGEAGPDGDLKIQLPTNKDIPGNTDWVIIRMGHTSTGHTNATGGGGKGLECDKFNPAAIMLQWNNWFAQAFEKTDPQLAKEVLKIFHVDSWECGSQNWSTNFPAEFKKRRGYDIIPWLPAICGIPVESVAASEKFLHDMRQTIAELINDVFYAMLKELAHEKGCSFSAEAIAPTMMSDGLLHYKNVDIPMGEFWLNSPTHDKPNDMLDAISGAHIYGKNIIQAEAFTSVRMNWGEHPGNMKAVGDRNFALGINKMVLHVFTHNPWLDKKPGMTLDGVGLYYQRDQTWFKQSKAWIDYLWRCQALLQTGKPVVDIAVFTGEEVPRRSVLPDRLVSILPGIFGKLKVESEAKRLANIGQPMRSIPAGVNHSANMADPEDWINPLNGYKYDCVNPDALMMMQVKSGRIVLPGGASYGVLVLPGKHPMQPGNNFTSPEIKKKIAQLKKAGAKIIHGLYTDSSFKKLGVQKDVEIKDNDHTIAWAHRKMADQDIYFIANQKDSVQQIKISFRVTGKMAEIWDPVTELVEEYYPTTEKNRSMVVVRLEANESRFIIFRKKIIESDLILRRAATTNIYSLKNWKVQFDKNFGGPDQPVIFNELTSWTKQEDDAVKYYSGTAIYQNTFIVDSNKIATQVRLEFDSICNIATIRVNGIDCGTLWTKPYELNITRATKLGVNNIEIEVANTWQNRLIGDNLLPAEKRVTWTTAPFRLKDKPLLPAGLIGSIKLLITWGPIKYK